MGPLYLSSTREYHLVTDAWICPKIRVPTEKPPALIGPWYATENFQLALLRERGRLPFLMMMTQMWCIINGFIDVSTADGDEDLDA